MTKEELYEDITDIYERTKAGELVRSRRIVEIDKLTEDYFSKVGEKPDSTALERMANLLLYEDLTNSHPDKMAREEYPIMSESQREERLKTEASEKLAEEYGDDGRNYRIPNRRKRSPYESKFVDKVAKARNKEWRDCYKDFVKGKSSGQFTVNIATGIKTVRSAVYH
ncbi:hypothetical protein [Niallia circulans]|uniref:hypothetical protein n=1 Tax=Niallia circulans TaxID=1397 RepID=UPI0026E99537|nr:hypothetical protein [Niallia circulans]